MNTKIITKLNTKMITKNKLSSLIATILTITSLSMVSVAAADDDVNTTANTATNTAHQQHNRHHSPRHSPQHSPQHAYKAMLKSVDLTAEQQQQIELLLQQHKAERENKQANKQQLSDYDRNDHRDYKAAMQQLMQAEQFDSAQAEQLIQQRQVRQQQRQLRRLKLHYDMLQVLTPEQRQQLADAKKNRSKLPRAKKQPV